MRTLSVCSGIGAPEASGHFHPVGMCEIDPRPASVLRRHFPGVPIYSDLADRSWWSHYAGVDCIIGGTPCQSFSVAGNMRGLDDERGNLMLSFLDLVDATRPRFVVWENVPGVLFKKNRPAFDLLVGELERMGYAVEHEVLNAQYFGVPQHRKRVFVVASPAGIGLADALAVREFSSVAGILEPDPAPKYDVSQRAAAGVLRRRDKFKSKPLPPVLRAALEAVAEGRELGEGELHLPTMSNGDDAVPTIRADATNYARCSGRSWNVDPMLVLPSTAPTMTATGAGYADCSLSTAAPAFVVTPAIAPTLTAAGQGFKDGAPQAKAPSPLLVTPATSPTLVSASSGPGVGTGHNGGDQSLLVTPTLTAAGNGFAKCGVENRTTPPFIVQSRRLRRFTPTECERLMGFPDGWTATDDEGREIKDTPRYRMLGNSMAVPVVGWIGNRIREVQK